MKRKWKSIIIIDEQKCQKIELDEKEKLPKNLFKRTRKCRSKDYIHTLGKYNCHFSNIKDPPQKNKNDPINSVNKQKQLSTQKEANTDFLNKDEKQAPDIVKRFTPENNLNNTGSISFEKTFEDLQEDIFT